MTNMSNVNTVRWQSCWGASVGGMTNQPLDSRGAFLLSQIGFHVSHRLTEQLARLDLDPAHFAVLTQLAVADGRSQQELADLLRVHRNAMVGLVDELEERGLVIRQPHPA